MKTKSNSRTVTKQMCETRAKAIAKILGAAEKWHSHGRGISMKDLESSEIKLQIDDFGKDKELSDTIRNYHGLCVDYLSNKLAIRGYIHTKDGMRRVM